MNKKEREKIIRIEGRLHDIAMKILFENYTNNIDIYEDVVDVEAEIILEFGLTLDELNPNVENISEYIKNEEN